MGGRHEIPDGHPKHEGQADIEQPAAPPAVSQHQIHRYQHQGRADQARRSASPLPVTEPAEGIDEQGQPGK